LAENRLPPCAMPCIMNYERWMLTINKRTAGKVNWRARLE